MRMMQQPFFNNKQILVIDQSPKNKNDRTWCFWEKQQGLFEPIVHHSWPQIDFYSNRYHARYDLEPYQYKMIRGIDFYEYVLREAKQRPNIHFYYGSITRIGNNTDYAIVETNDQTFSAEKIFNSILFDKTFSSTTGVAGRYFMWQHFKGWIIETEEPAFNPKVATFMDFRVHQNNGESFVYVLPITPQKALIEYTVFSPSVLRDEMYDDELKNYIRQRLKISSYQIIEDEFGKIPMTNYAFSKGEGNVVNTGTAGGYTKASSGFTFQFIQKHTASIVEAIITGKNPLLSSPFSKKRFHIYDNTLLHILHHKKLGADEIFASLFKKNAVQTVLKFLDNETTVAEELKIMSSVQAKIFFPAALNELFK